MLLTACGSSKKVSNDNVDVVKVTEKEEVKKNEPNLPAHFVSNLDLDIDDISLGGKISMKRDAVVRMNLTAMGLFEVGIIEFTPDYVLIVNKMGKDYCKSGYDFGPLQKNNITFDKVQQMAGEKLYSADGKKIKDESFDKMVEDMINANVKTGKRISVKIVIGKPDTSKDVVPTGDLSSKYTEIPASALMSKLLSLMK